VSEADDPLDVLVIGGGIHGAGVLQAAAAAGHSATMLEASALARGTSSRSSKLIHGGLRYLETAQLSLVHESLTERAILLRIASHLVHLVPFMIPIYRHTSRRPWQIRVGLSLYALLGNLRRTARFETLPRAQWDALDGLETDGLQAVFRYHDGQTDDARLVRAVVASARELGARLRCPAEFLAARRESAGWRVRYRSGDAERECTCRTLVNAGGPWVDRIQGALEPSLPRPGVELVAGAHVQVPGTLERGIYYTEAPRDRRAVFVMPWKGQTLVGTTETPYSGDPALVRPTDGEVEYLLETLTAYFPGHATEATDAWAGLRVLPRGEGRAFDRPREVTLVRDDERHPTCVSIYGGKLTGYRSTAQKVMHALSKTLPAATRRADTRTLVLPDPGPDLPA